MEDALHGPNTSLGAVSNSYSVVGIDDFNDDGTDDVLWRHTDGSLVTWNMDDMDLSSTTDYGAVPTAWTPLRVGEFEL